MIWPAAFVLIAFLSPLAIAATAKSTTVPLVIEDHRIFVNAQFKRADGSLRTARLWIDTGTPDFQITEKLAKDLGLDLSATPVKSEDGVPQILVKLPGLQIGGLTLSLQDAKPMVVIGEHGVFAGSQTDGNLPATILMHYRVVLDITHKSMTLSESGGQKVKGQRIACLVQPKSGMVQMEATIDGQKYSLALDSGAAYSMISSDAMRAWSAHHTDWPQVLGAAGAANVFGMPRLLKAPMMRIPEIRWGGLSLKNVGVLGMDSEFVSWYSKKTAAPVNGFLAWNVLRAFKVTIDYPRSVVYFEKQGNIDDHDADTVGLTLARSRSGGYAVLAVVQKDGHPVVDGIQAGDKLLKVDDREISNLSLEKAVEALAGRPDDVHVLVLDRKGTSVTIKATVMHLI